MHAPEQEVAKYRGKYDQGYAPIREARYRQAIDKGVIESKWEMSKGDVDWESFPNKEWDARCMEVYAAMVDRMDQGIGRITAELQKANALDNTLVIYLQDNGGCSEGYGREDN
ncbi:MAG: sulfatase-like hydrolase/transferase, partial [Planctomycetota bacterium]